MNNDDRMAEPVAMRSSRTMDALFHSADLRHVLPGIFVGSLLANLLALALPLAILQIMDRVIVNQAMSTLGFLALGLVAALVLEELLRGVNAILTSWLGARFVHRSTMAAMDHLFQVPMRRYLREEPSAYAERLSSTGQVARFYSGQSLLLLLDLPFALIFLILIYLIGQELVLVPTVLLLIFAFLTIRFGRSIQRRLRDRGSNDDRRSGFLFEVISGIHSVKTMMLEKLMLRRYEMLQRSSAELGEELARNSVLANSLGGFFSQFMILAVIFFGAWRVIDGQMTPGALAACLLLSVRSLTPLRRGLSYWTQYQGFVTADQRLRDLLSLPAEDRSGKEPLPPIHQGLTLRDIELSYSDRPLFSNVNLEVPTGSCIVIQGESGSGKTTLLNLLSGMEQPDRGLVLVDGHPLNQFAPDSYHHRIAMLPEAGMVVSGTILENLTMFDPALEQRALALASELGLDSVVAGMKLGYETRLGENASETLAMGARQLITIVRALCRDPEVILFDEANIALDMEGDRILRQYLEGAKGHCTLVLVTHRPSYLPLADQVYHLFDGQLRQGPSPRLVISAEGIDLPNRPEAPASLAHIIGENLVPPTDFSLCVLPLLEHLGWHGRPRELAEALPHLEARLDLSTFFAIMANLDYQTRHIGFCPKPPDERLLPYLFVPRHGAAQVVLKRQVDGTLRVFDGASGEYQSVTRLKGVGNYYLFQPVHTTAPAPAGSSWMAGLIHRFHKHIRLMLIVTFLATLLNLAPPLFIRSMYDQVIPVGDIQIGAYLMIGALIAIVLAKILTNFKGHLLSFVGGRAEYLLGVGIFQRILGLPSTAIEGVSVSRQVARIRGLERLREFFLGPMALLAFDLPATSILVLVLAILNPWMIVVLLGALAAFVITGLLARGPSERLVAEASRNSVARREFINETLSAMGLIRSTGAAEIWMERLRGLSARAAVAGFKEQQFNQRVRGMVQVLGRLTGLAALVVSAVLVVHDQISAGVLLATMIITWRLTGPLENLFLAATSVVRIKDNVRQIDNLMRMPGEKDRGVRQTIRPQLEGALELARVSFRYANDADPALLGVSFRVSPRQLVAVTGHDGAGKSTLLKLILRLYSPQAGTLRLDRVDIRQITATDLRSRISYMPQSFELFYGTVAQNLRLVHPDASDEELRWAAGMAGLLPDVEALPDGFGTRISNSRINELPRGFRQRLSLARMMLKPASLILLDEPGTGMDQPGEAALMRCIEWLRGRATLIMVTLRPGHLRLADQVVYMEKGRITAMGPFTKIEEKIMAGLR